MTNAKNKEKVFIRIFWAIYLVPLFIVILIFYLIASGRMGFMPTFEDLENPENNLASEVITEDGKILGAYFYENRSFVRFDELSPNLVNALIATEDIRFYSHSGIDARGLARVVFKTILLGERGAGGGSTITQQLAKNLFPRDTVVYNWGVARNFNLVMAKFKEWVTAVKLERNYTKTEIMVMYLNTVPFGHLSFGVKSAARTFFDSSPDSLKIEESALLVGLLKAPTRYSPVLNPERSLHRRNIVLSQLHKYNYITSQELDSLRSTPIELNFQIQDHNEGYATYFREYLRVFMNYNKPDRRRYNSYAQYRIDSAQWLNNPLFGWCNKNTKPDGTPYNLYKDGLRIYTTINYKMQKYAEEAVHEHLGGNIQPAFFREKKGRSRAPFSRNVTNTEINQIMNSAMRRTDRYRILRNRGLSQDSIMNIFNTPTRMRVFSWNGDVDTIMSPMDSIRYYKYFLRNGFVAIQPQNGHVKAYVGGPNYRHFKYDHVMVGKRQVGSTIKPFLYTVAMQEGYTPCYEVPNIPTSFYVNDTVWTPKNSGPSAMEGKWVTLKWGLTNSVNFISAWIMKRFNPQVIIDVMQRMGVTSYLDPVPSLVLGTSDVTLFEMVSAYTTYANKGVHVEPIFVTRIEDRNGNLISEFTPRMVEVFSDQTAYLMLDLLKGVVDRGTGMRLRYTYQFENEMAGKTGTTQNNSDGWFVGITPVLVGGAWVGGEDRAVHFDGITLGQGANMALPIWALFMKKIYADQELKISKGEFEKPENFSINLNCTTHNDSHYWEPGEEYEMY